MVRLATLFNAQRRVSVLACAITTAALGVEFSFTNQAAHADAINLVCQGSQTTTNSPGIKLTPQQVTGDTEGSLNQCQSSDPTLTSGVFIRTAKTTLSCTSLNSSPPPSDSIYNWNNGEFSLVRFTSTIVASPVGQIVITSTGTVTNGKFVGSGVLRVVTLLAPNPLQCVSPEGVTTVTGLIELTFTQL